LNEIKSNLLEREKMPPKIPSPPKQTSKFRNYVEMVKQLYLKPTEFFKQRADETDYLDIFLKYIIFIAIIKGLLFIIGIYGDALEGAYLVIFSLILAILSIILSFLVPFITSGIVHIGVVLFGGKGEFIDTFRSATYSLMIGAIYSFLASLGFEILSLIIPIPIFTNEISIMTPHLIVGGIVLFAGLIHTIWTMVIGLNTTTGLTKTRSLLAILLIPAIVFITLLLISVILGVLIATPLI